MFRHVLVPVDLSERGERGVQRARELVGKGETSLTLLHVIETIEGVPESELEDFYARLREKAEETLGIWADRLGGDGRVRHEIRLGRRSREIVAYAREQDVDLIVLTSHAIDPERPGEGLGTISHRVALLAPCSVLLLR